MTDQPAAQPTPGPITCHLCGKTGLSSVGTGPKYKHNILKCVPEMAAERDRLVKAIDGLVTAIDDLISESHGVDGLHLNGDVAPWDELLPGGQYESWLGAIDPARAVLDEAAK